ncbi:MAG: aconitate hydratase AcnA [Alphaproteobacteria bacterium]|nr:aconitate hydratase AcnA [Alphaproteobacteria bacterium]
MNSLFTKSYLQIGNARYAVHNLNALDWASRLPYSLKVLLENVLRHEDGVHVTKDHILAFKHWSESGKNPTDIEYSPARVLMQDFTGVPAIVDLAAMRDAIEKAGSNPEKINPITPVDLVIDHSVIVDHSGGSEAFQKNVALEFQRNTERYEFLKWGQSAFKNFRVVPPGTGICHQVNLEYLAKVVWTKEDKGEQWAFPDTVIGTDSHTTMINGLGVLGWGVGGIEAEATTLGLGMSMTLPEVIGFKLTGKSNEGVTATDIVLTVTEMLRKKGVVEKFVEFYGSGLDHLSLADRATISNMAPEYGATCGYFPVDQETLNYLRLTNRSPELIQLVEQYTKSVGLWRERDDLIFTDSLELDLSTIVPSVAGPKRPQDRIPLSNVASRVSDAIGSFKSAHIQNTNYQLKDGAVVIAAITSCTNTSNPSVMIGAGLLAKNAVEKGLTSKPWVKTSLAPGSQVVTEYLNAAHLTPYLDQLGFNLVGYGCTTCIGNSGPLDFNIAAAIDEAQLDVAAVLSGNRNFEGRIHPQVKLSFLASPLLVVAYALVGTTLIEFENEPIGITPTGHPIYLKDIWPSNDEIQETLEKTLTQNIFHSKYANVFEGSEIWRHLTTPKAALYPWKNTSSYVRNPPYFENFTSEPLPLKNIENARLLAVFGDSITTDHISPAGNIKSSSPAGKHLQNLGVSQDDFNSYGSRRGNHEIMMRGTFANIRIQNELTPENQGGFAKDASGNTVSIYDAAMVYKAQNTPLIVIAGKEYGTGSSRDWAAKGTKLLGIQAVIAESFERIHRSNLVGMGVLPLTFMDGITRKDLQLSGNEIFNIPGLKDLNQSRTQLDLHITYADGAERTIPLLCRLDTESEIDYYRHGGILPYVLRTRMM